MTNQLQSASFTNKQVKVTDARDFICLTSNCYQQGAASGHSLQNEYHRTTVGICPEGREGGEPRYFAPQQQTFLNAKHLQEVSEAHAENICSFTGPVQRPEEWLTPTC